MKKISWALVVIALVGVGLWLFGEGYLRREPVTTVDTDKAVTFVKDELNRLERAVEAIDRQLEKEVEVHVSVSSDDVVDTLGRLVREYRRSRDRL